MKRGLLRFNVLRSARLDFCGTDLFRGSAIDFCFMFTEGLMKDVARKLIHVRKIFNCRVSFKMLFSMCLVFIGKELWTWLRSSNFQNATFEKNARRWRKSFSSKRPFLPLVLNKNNSNKHAEYHGIFMLFKVQIYSKQGSHICLLFGT